jgi:peptide deformylase
MKKLLASIALLLFATGYGQKFTKDERRLITSGRGTDLMRVLQVTDSADLRILKAISTDIDPKDKDLPLLIDRMYATVNDSLNAGVGIAAPQVGINRNIIWVQRFDKPGEPFEVYLNPKIIWRSKLMRKGAEGCLSIPDIRGDVLRNYTIRITYLDRNGKPHDEMVEGFTAVIFQHEIDHLLGILFPERLTEQNAKNYSLINGEVNLYLEERLRRQ